MIYMLGSRFSMPSMNRSQKPGDKKKKKRKNFQTCLAEGLLGDCEQVIGYSQVLENQALVNNSTIL